MAKNNSKHAKTPAETRKVWVIESREIPSRVWRTYGIREDRYPEWQLVKYCEELSEMNHPYFEFRYRLGSLILDPSDKCAIFKSE